MPAGQFPLFSGVRVFDEDYKNPRVYSFNVGYEQELATDCRRLRRLHLGGGRNLTRFLNYNRSSRYLLRPGARHRQPFVYTPALGRRSSTR